MRVMALHAEDKKTPGACEIYRVIQPYHELHKRGWQVGWDNMRSVFMSWFMAYKQGRGELAVHQLFSQLDMIVLPRSRVDAEQAGEFVDAFFEAAHLYGVKTVYEVDDDFTNAHRTVIEGSMSAIASRCDAITVTTPYLADTMRKQFNKPTYVLPNFLAPEIWREGTVHRPLSEDTVMIWLSGSSTHENDWRVLETVLPALLQKHPQAILAICGYHPDYLKNIDGVLYEEGRDYITYAGMVRQSDIVLAPVDPEDQFNMGKSPIKATEGQGAVRKVQNQFCGAAVIATNNPVYRLSVRDGQDGMLVKHEPQAWFDAMDKLLTDKAFRLQLQRNAYKRVWVKGEWDASRQWKRWADAYTKIGNLKTKVALEGVKEG